MAQATLDQLISQLDTLQNEELQRLERAIQERRTDKGEAKEKEMLHQALLASGLVKRIASRTEPDRSERHLIEVQGEPVSETIIRERR